MTLADAQIHLDAWLAADLALAEGKEAKIDTATGSRSLKLEDAAEIRANITRWQKTVSALTAQAAGVTSDVTVRLATWN